MPCGNRASAIASNCSCVGFMSVVLLCVREMDILHGTATHRVSRLLSRDVAIFAAAVGYHRAK